MPRNSPLNSNILAYTQLVQLHNRFFIFNFIVTFPHLHLVALVLFRKYQAFKFTNESFCTKFFTQDSVHILFGFLSMKYSIFGSEAYATFEIQDISGIFSNKVAISYQN
ncbi:MAG: hypothetical protein ACOZBL_03305 [Patescibacteria group bacterium]